MGILSPKSIKIFITLTLYLYFFSEGFCAISLGPCLLDLQTMINTDTQHISVIFAGRSAGFLLGFLIGGVVLDATRSKQIVLTALNFIVAISTLGIPWSRDIGTLTGLIFAQGFGLAVVDVGGNVLCLTLWERKSGPFYQALHLSFGLGALVAPLIIAPFLSNYANPSAEDNSIYSNLTNAFNHSNTGFPTGNNSETDYRQLNIIYPFSIIGGFCLLVTLMFLAAAIISPTEEKRSQNINSNNQNVKFVYLCSVVLLNTLFLFAVIGIEVCYPQMLTTYLATGPLQLSPSVGSYMTSSFFTAFTVSRLVSVFLAIKFSSLTLIVCNLTITFIGSLIVLSLSSYEWAFWISSVFLGAGVATSYPSSVSWINSYIDVTNKIASFFSIGIALVYAVVPYSAGYFMKQIPDILIYIVFILGLISCLTIISLYFILPKIQKKDTKNDTISS